LLAEKGGAALAGSHAHAGVAGFTCLGKVPAIKENAWVSDRQRWRAQDESKQARPTAHPTMVH
jgi:hypothetical protein